METRRDNRVRQKKPRTATEGASFQGLELRKEHFNNFSYALFEMNVAHLKKYKHKC